MSPPDAPKRPRGRPPVDPHARRDHHRATRLDERELDLLARLSDALGTGESDVLRLGLEALAKAHGVAL